MKIYADMLFAINFSMDLVSLFLSASIMKRKIHKKRILIASAIGGAYGVLDVILTLNSAISVVLGVFVSFLMCFIAYFEKSIKRFTALYVIYWGVSASLGGFMSVLYSFLNKILAKYIENYNYTTVYTGARFFVIASLSILASVLIGRVFSSEKDIKSAEVLVKIEEKEYCFGALCDSGNLLREPLSGKSVILISSGTQLGKKILQLPDIKKRYIPYSAVGGEGLLKGISPAFVSINGNEVSAIVASIDKNDFAGYEACVPTALMK